MVKEIWLIGSGEYENKSKNYPSSDLTEKGFEMGKKNGLELIKKSKAVKEKSLKYIYCSPYISSIQTAIQIIEVIKEKMNYEIKIIIVYGLEYNFINESIEFKGDKLIISYPSTNFILNWIKKNKKTFKNFKSPKEVNKILDHQQKTKYKKYIKKKIGKQVNYFIDDKLITNQIAKNIININKKEKESYIILGSSNTFWINFMNIGYKYFNQNNNSISNIKNNFYHFDTELSSKKLVNMMIGFKKVEDDYNMFYKPNNQF